MANNGLILGQSHDQSLRPNSHLGFDHIHGSDSVHELGPEDFQGMDIGCKQDDRGLDQSQTCEHDMTSHTQLQQLESLEENGDKLDVDDQDQDHAHSDNYDNRLALSNEAFELNLSNLDNLQLAIIGDHDLPENLEFSLIENEKMDNLQVSDMIDEQTMDLVCTPPVLQSRALDPSPNHQLIVGKKFSDIYSCRLALREAAIALRFEMRTIKSDKDRFTAECASKGCPWRIHASKLSGVPSFTIRTIRGPHTCARITHLGHQQASVQWIANSVDRQLGDNPDCKQKEILEQIHRDHGITLSYKQAWRGKERIMAKGRGSFEEDYRLLPQYCDQLKRSNPGSIAMVCGNPSDGCFQSLFISFQASIYGFLNACRPLIGLDCVPLKSKYLGTLLLAISFDGDGGLYPLAFGVVGEETDDNWMWFLSKLHTLLETNVDNMPMLSILSSRKKGIVDGVDMNFPTVFHGFCMHHLSEMFREEFGNDVLSNILWEAACSLTAIDFEIKILEIQEISEKAAAWIRKIPPQFWATAYFEGSRFGQLTTNVVESLNSLISKASGLPLIQMMECIRKQLMTLFNERREASMQWSSILVPSVEKAVSEAIEQAQMYQVVQVKDAEFEVFSHTDPGQNIVDIRTRRCSCYGWQKCGLPCSHAVAALLSCRQNVHRFTESYFTVASYRKAYSQTIHPIPDRTMWNKLIGPEYEEGGDNSTSIEVVITPPKSITLLTKPRKRRASIAQESDGRMKRVVHCSLCNQTGHYRSTCTVPM